MGRIVEARDRRHRRRVALKLLLVHGRASQQRFAREIAVTARLQHPSIVAVYEAGFLPSGEPFFAMRLVEGCSLAEAAARAHDVRERQGLLPHLLAACDALAYAHGEGVIHRDLKPANVLVGDHGETVVIDWGLAKELSAPDDGVGAGASSDPLLTSEGHVLGTPAYMPPEQARGEPVDARADVYALGTLLYHLLAGEAPYRASSGAETLRDVLAGPPRPLRQVAPELPADLVTIVEKAMARAPAERYASARELAGDLRAYTTGKLVSAHSYGAWALVKRFVARHRAPVAVGVVSAALLVGTLAVGIRRIVGERDGAVAAEGLASAAQRAAATHREGAERLLTFMLSTLRERLAGLGRLDLLQGVADEVEAYYRGLGDTPAGGDALVRRVEAFRMLADVRHYQLRYDDVRALAQQGLALAAQLPPGRTRSDLRAGLLRRRASADQLQQKTAAARAGLLEAVAELGDGGPPLELADVLKDLARLTSEAGDGDAAVALLARARTAAERAPRDAAALRRLAAIEGASGDLAPDPEAAVAYRRTLALLAELRRLMPDDARPLTETAVTLTKLIPVEQTPEAARERLVEAIALWEDVVRRFPENRLWHFNLAGTKANGCHIELSAGRLDEARAFCLAAIAHYDALLVSQPDYDLARHNLALTRTDLTDVELGRGDLRAARAASDTELALARSGSPSSTSPLKWRRVLEQNLRQRGRIALREQRWDEAGAAFGEARSMALALAAMEPDGDRRPLEESEAALRELARRRAGPGITSKP